MFLGSRAIGCAAREQIYASAIVTTLVRGGIARPGHPPGDIWVCIKDKAIERAAIKACRIESTTPACNRAYSSTARVSVAGNRVVTSV